MPNTIEKTVRVGRLYARIEVEYSVAAGCQEDHECPACGPEVEIVAVRCLKLADSERRFLTRIEERDQVSLGAWVGASMSERLWEKLEDACLREAVADEPYYAE